MTKKTVVLAGKLAVTGLLLYFVLRDVAVSDVAARLTALSPLPIVGAVALIALQSLGIVTWRWEMVLAAIDRAVPPWRLTGMVAISLFFNQVLPSTIGGDGMRMWLLRRAGRPLGAAVRSVIIDRMLGLLGLLLLCALGAATLVWSRPDSAPLWGILGAALAGIAIFAGAPLALRLADMLPGQALSRWLAPVVRESQVLLADKALLAKLVAVSVLGHVLICLAIWLTAAGIGVRLVLPQSLAVIPAVLLAASLPISVAGWGVREGGMVVGLGMFGVATGDAALVSIVFGLLMLAFSVVGGLTWLAQRGPKPPAEPLELSGDLAAAAPLGPRDKE